MEEARVGEQPESDHSGNGTHQRESEVAKVNMILHSIDFLSRDPRGAHHETTFCSTNKCVTSLRSNESFADVPSMVSCALTDMSVGARSLTPVITWQRLSQDAGILSRPRLTMKPEHGGMRHRSATSITLHRFFSLTMYVGK
jgi:hypothetical protein